MSEPSARMEPSPPCSKPFLFDGRPGMSCTVPFAGEPSSNCSYDYCGRKLAKSAPDAPPLSSPMRPRSCWIIRGREAVAFKPCLLPWGAAMPIPVVFFTRIFASPRWSISMPSVWNGPRASFAIPALPWPKSPINLDSKILATLPKNSDSRQGLRPIITGKRYIRAVPVVPYFLTA